jgi:2-keto-4-pentenoate hydratase/2-oxohepta-3-ene-1,7-dioic acid hydratase in catechol pathway
MTDYIFKEGIKRNIKIGKLVCLARTYKKHAEEMKSSVPEDPLLFLKPASSIIFNNGTIVFPEMSNCLHHEVELGVIIGKKCKNIKENDALDYVLGYCLCLDITARDIQSVAKKNGWPWSIAKGFDTFAPISDVILKDEISDPNNLDISLRVNGTIRQSSNTKNMVFSVEYIIEFISKIMTLEPGDLIMTGTPEGVGEIKKGDVLEADLGDFCSLKIYVE